MFKIHAVCMLALTIAALPAAAFADDYTIILKDHHFNPEVLEIPAHRKVNITVRNLQAAPAEFESSELHREKVVAANGGEITILIGPLEAGAYHYGDDFHEETKGSIVAK